MIRPVADLLLRNCVHMELCPLRTVHGADFADAGVLDAIRDMDPLIDRETID